MNSKGNKILCVLSIALSLHANRLNAVGIRRYQTDLYENDFCGLNTSIYSGKCKRIDKCINLLVEKKDIEVCSFGQNRGEETLVCCSREDFYKSRMHNKDGILNYEACAHNYKHLRSTESSTSSPFVINGVDVEPHEFSHIAAIGWLQYIDLSVAWNCAGNLITEHFVMSAAHCMIFDGRKPNVVRLGDIDLKTSADDQFVQQFGIYSIVKHPKYNYDTNEHDIALIRLRGRVFPTRNVVPACLNHGQIPTEYFEGAAYGQDETHKVKNILSKVQLKLVDMTTCKKSYDIQLSEQAQICAEGYREDLPMQDLCYGDSGSSLQYINKDMVENELMFKIPTLVGITSFGIGCAFGFPSVYVNISYYIDWMESVISP